ncbi:MAG: DUF1778 domain-containing protein [Acidobacteriota bacterium]|nr:DUF1778 domain-containing protein [Acidobacteriota bacterium]
MQKRFYSRSFHFTLRKLIHHALYSLDVDRQNSKSSRAAKGVVEKREHLQLSERDSIRLLKLLDAPPSPNAKLLAAAKSLPDSR